MSRSTRALLIAAACAAAQALPYGHPSPDKSYPVRPGFTLWLVEEFDAPLDLNTDPIWTWSDGGLNEGRVRFTKDGVKFQGGRMKLEVRAERQHGSCSHAEVGHVSGKDLRSGELRTRHNMFRYGYYEVRMRAPTVHPGNAHINGNFIATMFTFRTAKFKYWREIDIEVTGDTPKSVTLNVISADNTRSWHAGMAAPKGHHAHSNLRSGFHTYAFEWLPSGITWFLDGHAIGFHGPGQRIPIPNLSAKIMMNLWIFAGSHFGGSQGWNNQYPMHSEYDWFRFYKWDGDRQYPCADAGGSCLPNSDRFLSSNNPCDGIPQVGGSHCQGACTWTMRALNHTEATAAANSSRVFYP